MDKQFNDFSDSDQLDRPQAGAFRGIGPYQCPVMSEQAGSALVTLWHVMGGIYFWEFFTTLDYEWRVIRGRLPHRYTIWLYSLTRVACLLGVILCTFGLDVRTPINCQVWMYFLALRYAWNPQAQNCLSVTGEKSVLRLSLVPTIFADLSLILIMLAGLLLLRRNGGGTFGLTPFLWKQAVIWLSLVIVVETPSTVIAVLSTNDQLADMILSPGLITMTIVATRMHRSLVDYASGLPDGVSARENNRLPMNSGVFSNTKRANSHHDGRIEVTVHTAFEQHTITQANDHDSYNGTKEHVHEKPDAWDPDNDVERANSDPVVPGSSGLTGGNERRGMDGKCGVEPGFIIMRAFTDMCPPATCVDDGEFSDISHVTWRVCRCLLPVVANSTQGLGTSQSAIEVINHVRYTNWSKKTFINPFFPVHLAS
ncbi:hypothetical protein BGY98DRAFT_1117716 [Russula aff. rugulosa BPL654]|nr:hypothetical protein BGY98DRAFT_1117716 [Russula aff. rugulosa BPL654]